MWVFEEAKHPMQVYIHASSHLGLLSLPSLHSAFYLLKSGENQAGVRRAWYFNRANNFTPAHPTCHLRGSWLLWSLRLCSPFSVRAFSSVRLPSAHILLISLSPSLSHLSTLLVISPPPPHSSSTFALVPSPPHSLNAPHCFILLLLSFSSLFPPHPIPPSRYDLCYTRSSMAHQMLAAIFSSEREEKKELNHSIGSWQSASIAEKCPRLPQILKHWWRTDFPWLCEFPSVRVWQSDCLACYYYRRFDAFPA